MFSMVFCSTKRNDISEKLKARVHVLCIYYHEISMFFLASHRKKGMDTLLCLVIVY